MIDWLASWLKEIILVVMFAIVTDMLLPNNSMQRYIKVVVSLFILLTILSPILTLLRSNDHLHDIEMGLNRWSTPQEEVQMASLSFVEAEAEKLRAAGESQTVSWVEQRLAAMVMEDLQESGYSEVHDIRARVDMTRDGQAVIQELTVMIREEEKWSPGNEEPSGDHPYPASSEQHQTGRSQLVKPVMPVKPVEPVIIDIVVRPAQVDEDKAAPTSGEQIGSAKTSVIRQHIARTWGILPERIIFRQTAR